MLEAEMIGKEVWDKVKCEKWSDYKNLEKFSFE